MKYFFLAIFVLIATQPLQVSACDMHDAQEISHNQHGNMQKDDGNSMDCCDHDPSDSSDGCDPMSHCGASTTAAATMDTSPISVGFVANSQQLLNDSGHPLNRFSSPPFRPPIA